jgi:hypothetical protein
MMVRAILAAVLAIRSGIARYAAIVKAAGVKPE